MKKKILQLLLPLFHFFSVEAQIDPTTVYGELFNEVQTSEIFKDSKTFADCTPRYNPELISQKYKLRKFQPNFSLQTFIDSNFILPTDYSTPFQTNKQNNINQHIELLWDYLKRNSDTIQNTSLIPLPYPYVVPGGRFREIYYWDSYFTMLGLAKSKRTDLIESMVGNFAFLLDTYQMIPNGNRTYYLSRSQPPFFALMVDLLVTIKGDDVYKRFLPQLLTEYNFWMQGKEKLANQQSFQRIVKMPDGEILNRYWDNEAKPRPESFSEDLKLAETSKGPKEEIYRNIRAACESGWDFSSRWLQDPNDLATIRTTEIIPIDLNCLLYHLEMTIAKCYQITNDAKQAKTLLAAADSRKKAILKYFWDSNSGFFMDYDLSENKNITNYTLAGSFPLYFNICNQEQADQVAKKIKEKLLAPGGLLTTEYKTGQQWDAPNGWAPLQYITISGLRNYNKEALAQDITKRWLTLIQNVFLQTGKLMEKYNVLDPNIEAGGGEYPSQDGFGWTNGVFLYLVK